MHSKFDLWWYLSTYYEKLNTAIKHQLPKDYWILLGMVKRIFSLVM